MKLILQILLILIIVATISICTIKPDLHKNIIVYDSAYTLVSEEEVKTETKEIPIMEKSAEPVNQIIKVQETKKAETKVIPKATVQTKPQKTTAKKETSPVVKTTTSSKNEPKVVKSNVNTNTNPVETITKVTQPIKTEQKVIQQETPKVLTQQEETIAWNKWRSGLTNQIMQDTKLPIIPNGVVFQFSFNVDKYGKISNVQTGADPANYTPYAIQYIAPVIRSYQGRSILNFPEGTARTSTTVTGKWRISNTERFSTPQDYNDIEKINK